jgi:hypothetical protein
VFDAKPLQIGFVLLQSTYAFVACQSRAFASTSFIVIQPFR